METLVDGMEWNGNGMKENEMYLTNYLPPRVPDFAFAPLQRISRSEDENNLIFRVLLK